MRRLPGDTHVRSLGTYVWALRAGEACFCCGGTMEKAMGVGAAEGEQNVVPALVCPRCGGQVDDLPEGTSVAEQTLGESPCRPVMSAA